MLSEDRTEFKRLTLQVERDAVAQAALTLLLKDARVAAAGHRQELRDLTSRMRRTLAH